MDFLNRRILVLEVGNFGDSALIKINRGTSVVFKLGSTLHGIQIQLFTNYPTSQNTYNRNQYTLLSFSDDHFDEGSSASFLVEKSGTFNFYFVIPKQSFNPTGGGWIVVDPKLQLCNQALQLDSISMITYMAKCLGKLKDWPGRIGLANEIGFNFVHFTPVQALGGSNSGYSILNQLDLNPNFGDVTWNDLKLFITKMKQEWGMFSLCDIVLNHTANESPWLKEHPESAFNLKNSPHLIPAYLLDRLLFKIGEEIANDIHSASGVPSTFNSEEHMSHLKILLADEIRQLRLEEFYLINPSDCRLDTSPLNGNRVNVNHTYKRFGSKVGGSTPSWKVEQLNEESRTLITNHLDAAIENVLEGIRYERIQPNGPKYTKVTTDTPLIHRYFEEVNGIPEAERNAVLTDIDPEQAPFIMAHNGWVMNDDPLRNFADEDSNVYLRRELIAWDDSIKLRFGQSPADSPFLWSHMKKYVEQVASVFQGVRLDNCHSTPLHVAEYLIDAARVIQPELLVVAELFTNSDAKDNVFVNRLGINVLIREAQQAWNSHEQGRLLFRYGGKPVGAFENTIPPAIADALFFDQTHDNPSPLDKRSIKDVLPTAAMVAFGAFAIGTNRGYDDIVPHHIHVVNESRFYTSLNLNPTSPGEVNLDYGMFQIRKTLNRIHCLLGQDGFSETYIDQLDPDVVSVTRGNPRTRESMVLVAYTAFSIISDNFRREPYSIRTIEVQGEVTEIVFEGHLIPTSDAYERNDTYLTGVKCDREWKETLPIEKSEKICVLKESRISRVEFVNLQPGDVIAFRVRPFEPTSSALSSLAKALDSSELGNIVNELDLVTLNYVLYRCKEEEGGIYNIPNFGDLVYAGLQGIASILDDVSLNNDLGHPICVNLRAGNWLMDYIVNRFKRREESKLLGEYTEQVFGYIKDLPNYLVPTYFEQVVRRIHFLCLQHALKLMGVENKGELTQLLALTSLQFVGIVEGASLPAGSEVASFIENGKPFISYSIAAGLPHFSTGYMRNWGRDTFIALPGLLLLTNRYEEAKQHILSYASVLRHGLIPNLLNKGNCRYNCRDATWWWLYAILRYIKLVPNGVAILKETVNWDSKIVPLEDVMHSAIQAHYEGIKFREHNAGSQIDAHMKDEGFNIEVYVDPATGFIHGGNSYNCGTWMDKMGSSELGGNRGVPATPRDGAAVEIIGLLAAVLKTLSETSEYSHKTVDNLQNENISYEEWYSKIMSNFESQFFISESSQDPLVNVRNIYKDTLASSKGFGDYQLRPNFLIAMVVAPELFSAENALKALNVVKDKLVSKLGIRTLDTSDWNYNGDYYNSDTSDYKTACGLNYHQGPEWLWPMGFYLRARLHFDGINGISEIRQILGRYYEYLKTDRWRSLPELTNKDGNICTASCPAQAWSSGTLLEVLFDLEKY